MSQIDRTVVEIIGAAAKYNTTSTILNPSPLLFQEAKDACKSFLTKNPAKRLGCAARGGEDVRTHPFFRRIDWARVEARDVQPPFKPKIVRYFGPYFNFL